MTRNLSLLSGGAVSGPFDDVETAEQASYREERVRVFVIRAERGKLEPPLLRVNATLAAPVLVGSSQVCALRIRDPQVSRRHLALELGPLGLRLRDLDSTNGTRVDGVRVVEVVLQGGEQVEIGGTLLRVEAETSRDSVELPAETSFGRVFGASAAMRRLYPLFRKLAEATIPVIIEGETGTGKEALAEAIHEASPRSNGPFVVFDCTAVPANLLESELFGHERGAFTGAVSSRSGVFEQAHRGTLLIDEIGDLDPALQPKLLRALERSEVRPLGGSRSVRVDVRVLAATRRDLDREVQEGRFRDDLFHRLAVARVELPPLRNRSGDIVALARHFWTEFAEQSRALELGRAGPRPELLRRWERETWPGNVRQLRNAVARTLALDGLDDGEFSKHTPGSNDSIAPGSDWLERILAERLPLPMSRERVLREFERRYVEHVLARQGGNVTRAAQESGVALRYFQLLRARQRT